MKVDNLAVGQKVKNYKTLCELLGESIKQGNSKVAQLKQWEQYFTWHKQGNSFIIDSIVEKVEHKTDKKSLLISNTIIGKKCPFLSTNKPIRVKKLSLDNKNIRDYRYKIKVRDTRLLLENLFVGQFLPNAVILANTVGRKPPRNKHERQQLINELELYVTIIKNINRKGMKGRGYMINEIISTDWISLEKEYKYYNGIRDMFLLYFLTNKDNEHFQEYFYKNNLFAIADICNPIYFENKKRMVELAQELNIPQDTVRDFFNIVDNKLNDIVMRNLNKMYKEFLLSKFEQSFQVVALNENGEKEYRVATDSEIIEIQYAIFLGMQEYNNSTTTKIVGFGKENIAKQYNKIIKHIHQIPNLDIKEFTKLVIEKLKKTCPHIVKYYPCYLVRFNHKVCNYYLSRFNINEMEPNDLNQAFFSSLLKTFEKNSIKANNNQVPKYASKYKENRKDKESYDTLADKNIKK